MNEVVDIAFIAAKVAAMKDEKARMIVGGVSLAYNVSQIARFKAMIVEFSQLCNYIVCVARFRGYCTQEEYNIVIECQQHIEDCNRQIAKHGTMTIIDGISLLIDGLSSLNRR